MLFVKPAVAGLIVRDPERNFQPIPEDGIDVPAQPYWLRRLRDGDVVEVKGAVDAAADGVSVQVEEPAAGETAAVKSGRGRRGD